MILYIFQGKKGVWIKLPIELANLVETAVKVISLYFSELEYDSVHVDIRRLMGFDLYT